MRLSKKQISEIIELYNSGVSLSKISQKLAIGKSTIYYHTRKNFGRKFNKIAFNDNLKEELGEFVGTFAGDGNFYFGKEKYAYIIRIFVSGYERAYANSLCGLIFKLFGKYPNVYFSEDSNCFIVRIMSRDIYEIIKKHIIWEHNKTLSVRLKHDIDTYEQTFLKGFVRGLFNTDGNVYVPKKRVSFSSISKRLIYQASDILNNFDIEHSVYEIVGRNGRKDIYCVSIMVKDAPKFEKVINLTNPYKKEALERCLMRL